MKKILTQEQKNYNESQAESVEIILQALKQAEQDGTQADNGFMDNLIFELDKIENGRLM